MKIGDLVIINEVDRPCAELIAVVTKVDGEKLPCRYLSAKVEGYEGKDIGTTISRASLAKDFGICVDVEEFQFTTDKREYSDVKYDDGRVRTGQGRMHEVQPLAKEWWIDNNPIINLRTP